jgi:alpha-amylase/alpha-mannosidase (GH57 family)
MSKKQESPSVERKIEVVFLWHMHQPDYRLPGREHGGGENVLPWVYLHALKDYTDMVAHLERHPKIRAVVNFVPVLLDQIEDYVAQLSSGALRDPLLCILAHRTPDALSLPERRLVLDSCFRTNHVRMIEPFPAYKRLLDLYELVKGHGDAALQYLSGSYFMDLVTWYHLAWTGETVRRQEPLVARLMSRGEGFTHADRLQLLDLIRDTLASLIPRYRSLAERGQIEISATPYAHPLAPLMLDFHSAREAEPNLALPQAQSYPGGRDRVQSHIATALADHERRFGAPPAGMWPAEGAISGPFLNRLSASGCRWAASGEGVLRNSISAAAAGYRRERDLYRSYRMHDCPKTTLFFRDDRLSDLIGFEYAKWHGKDAAQHFVAEINAIRESAGTDQRPILAVILDGENAWEYYPYNAYYFFEDLYDLLEEQEHIHTNTFSGILADSGPAAEPRELAQLVAGSWVYGTLTTWIGDRDKNRAWDMLCDAKQAYDWVMGSGRLDEAARQAATARLAVCESSDWFWWFGDYNPATTVAAFDSLFRANIMELYRLLDLPPPARLEDPISCGGGTPESAGTMRRSS